MNVFWGVDLDVARDMAAGVLYVFAVVGTVWVLWGTYE